MVGSGLTKTRRAYGRTHRRSSASQPGPTNPCIVLDTAVVSAAEPIPGEGGRSSMGDESSVGAFGARQSREQFLKRAGAAGAALAAGGGYAGLASKAAGARYGRNARGAVKGQVSIRYWGQGP